VPCYVESAAPNSIQGIALATFLGVIGLGIVVFATTNIDDILLLSAFFADRTLRARAIIVGQFAGIGALTGASIVAALLALTIPEGWTALLGLAPLALGIKGLRALWSGATLAREATETQPPQSGTTDHKQWTAIAAVTIANGGDNLAVYIPLFSRELVWVPVFVIVFAVMTAVWCLAGYWLVNHPQLGARVRQYGHVALPFVLIGLGLYILWDTRVLLT
jgi:cadmium resistance protein CadD (predicted permease)